MPLRCVIVSWVDYRWIFLLRCVDGNNREEQEKGSDITDFVEKMFLSF